MTVLAEPLVVAPPESDVIADTLHWVNDERVKMGKAPIEELPKGEPGSYDECPLALALGTTVGSRVWGDLVEQPLPACAQKFVENFDYVAYPELVA